MGISQNRRGLRIESSPLSEDELLLTGVRGREALSEPFSFQLELLSENWKISPHRIVGRPVTFSIPLDEESKRHFNGVVRRFSRGPATDNGGLCRYRAELVPWLWFLIRSSNCRVFSKKSVKDILEKIFETSSIAHAHRFDLSGEYPAREYCVQYRETDFAFVSRLLEEEGMFYYFRHAPDKHELIVADAATAYKNCAEGTVEYFPGDRVGDRITFWDHGYEFRSGSSSLNDYNFEAPRTDLTTRSRTRDGMSGSEQFALYDYPGGYTETSLGDRIVRVRMEQEEVPGDTVTAESTCRTLHPAGCFTLHSEQFAPEDHNERFVLVSVEHEASDASYLQERSGGLGYGNRIVCIPAKTDFRPARTTPKPSVQGLESAVVVGADGKPDGRDKDAVHTDKYGRVKVKFHWDRAEKSESCWVRTSQSWAGSGWGTMFLPRVGQEVVVSFLGGDPDRPVVTGSVYNAERMPAYGLPDDSSQSGIKSRSWPQGESDMFNELRFDDKKDKESVYFQAQKDFSRLVKHDDSLKVENNRTVEIKKDVNSTISEGNESHTLKEGNRSVTLDKGNDTLKLQAGNLSVTLDKGNYKLELPLGDAATKLSAGKCTTEAGESIELKVGGNSIKIDQTGITIKGIQIKIQADAMVQVKGPMSQIAGDGMLTLKGGVVMIN